MEYLINLYNLGLKPNRHYEEARKLFIKDEYSKRHHKTHMTLLKYLSDALWFIFGFPNNNPKQISWYWENDHKYWRWFKNSNDT